MGWETAVPGKRLEARLWLALPFTLSLAASRHQTARNNFLEHRVPGYFGPRRAVALVPWKEQNVPCWKAEARGQCQGPPGGLADYTALGHL